MKKIFFATISIFVFSFTLLLNFSFAQGMMGFSGSSADNATIQSQQQEELEGKKLLDDLSNKIITCSQISDSDFDKIGEYFMGQSIGDTSRHIAMNEMMKSMMGEQGEEQAHIAMGKRMSGCDPNAPMPQNMMSGGMMSMMMGGGMMGGWSNSSALTNNSNNPMMNFGFGLFGGFGWIFMILWWVLIIAGIVVLIKWLVSQSHSTHDYKKSLFEILKERYAKGEIDKKEFEERKKDLI